MPITPEFPVRFLSAIQGIACTILVTHYLPAEPAITSGPMEDAEEACPAEFEYQVYYPSGLHAQLLESTITQADEDRIFDEFEAYLLALKHDKDF